MKEITLETYQQLFEKLLNEIEKTSRQHSSQPQFLLGRVKGKIYKYLENMFYATEFTEEASERIYDPEWQKELTCALYAHFQSIKQKNWSHFNFNLIELFEFCMMEVCAKYHVNANIEEIRNIPKTIGIEEKIKTISSKNKIIDFPEIASLKQLESYPLYLVLQIGKNYFSRVAPYSVFAKIFHPTTQRFSFKAYYYDPENEEIKRENNAQLVIESKKNGVYIKDWQPLLYSMTDEVKINERPLTSYEENDFKLGIEGLIQFHQSVLKLFESEELRWMLLVLSEIIVSYLTYEIPFKLIGQISTNDPDDHEYLNRRPGLELFDRMKTGEVYTKHNRIFYYCSESYLIHFWTEERLKKRIYFDYMYLHPLDKARDFRLPGDAIVEKRSLERNSNTQKILEFITESTNKNSKSGNNIFLHKWTFCFGEKPLLYKFRISNNKNNLNYFTGINFFQQFPSDLIIKILMYLNIKMLCTVNNVSKNAQEISNLKLLWEDKLSQVSDYKVTEDQPKAVLKKINELSLLKRDDRYELGEIGEAALGDSKIAEIVLKTSGLIKKLNYYSFLHIAEKYPKVASIIAKNVEILEKIGDNNLLHSISSVNLEASKIILSEKRLRHFLQLDDIFGIARKHPTLIEMMLDIPEIMQKLKNSSWGPFNRCEELRSMMQKFTKNPSRI